MPQLFGLNIDPIGWFNHLENRIEGWIRFAVVFGIVAIVVGWNVMVLLQNPTTLATLLGFALLLAGLLTLVKDPLFPEQIHIIFSTITSGLLLLSLMYAVQVIPHPFFHNPIITTVSEVAFGILWSLCVLCLIILVLLFFGKMMFNMGNIERPPTSQIAHCVTPQPPVITQVYYREVPE